MLVVVIVPAVSILPLQGSIHLRIIHSQARFLGQLKLHLVDHHAIQYLTRQQLARRQLGALLAQLLDDDVHSAIELQLRDHLVVDHGHDTIKGEDLRTGGFRSLRQAPFELRGDAFFGLLGRRNLRCTQADKADQAGYPRPSWTEEANLRHQRAPSSISSVLM